MSKIDEIMKEIEPHIHSSSVGDVREILIKFYKTPTSVYRNRVAKHVTVHRKHWMSDEIDILTQFYRSESTVKVAIRLGRTYDSVSKMARKLGL